MNSPQKGKFSAPQWQRKPPQRQHALHRNSSAQAPHRNGTAAATEVQRTTHQRKERNEVHGSLCTAF